MKRVLISMLAVAALVSCSKSDENNITGTEPVNPEGRTPILLSAGVPTLDVAGSKAPIVQGSSFIPQIMGWEVASGNVIDYKADCKWNTISNANITAHSSTASDVILAAPQYYNANNTTKTYIRAWYPKDGTLDASKGHITFANPATDGSLDVLLADEIYGSKNDNASKVLAFKHLTTQLKFKVEAGAGLAASTKIQKITLKDVQTPDGIDLTATGATDPLIGKTAGPLMVPNISADQVIGVAAPAGDAVMIKALTTGTFKIDVETSTNTFNGVDVNVSGPDIAFTAGKAFTITLTFGQNKIENLTAKVTDWTPGAGTGSVN